MKWVRDNTRRFQRRPYYAQQEIDVQCEDVVARFFKGKGGTPSYPISTDDLTVMIEQDVSSLDLYAIWQLRDATSRGSASSAAAESRRCASPGTCRSSLRGRTAFVAPSPTSTAT